MTQANPENATIAQSYLQMPYNQYVWLRKEFMSLCNDALEAMIMRVVEYEIEGDRRVWLRKAAELAEQGKPIPEEPEWWITLSHKQIIARLYDAFKNEKTVRAKLQSLEEKRFILVRQNPDSRYGAPQYTINKDLIQRMLNALPPLPCIRDAAKSQANPLPETVPPTKSGTPYQERQGAGTRFGGREVPKTAGGTSQSRQGAGTKSGTPYKKGRNEDPQERERETPPVRDSQTPASSLSLSSEISSAENPDSTCRSRGMSPASVKGGSSILSEEEIDQQDYVVRIRRDRADNPIETTLVAQNPAEAPTNVADSYSLDEAALPTENTMPTSPNTTANAQPLRPRPGEKGCAPVPMLGNNLLSSLTEEQAAFWRRWCGASQTAYNSLNETAYNHVVELAGKILTEDLQSLYDYEFDRLGALARTRGTNFVPPRLGNLVNAHPDWSKARTQKARERTEERAAHNHIPGTGNMVNYTDAKAFKDEPPLDYSYAISRAGSKAPPKAQHKPVTNTLDATALLAQIELRRAQRQETRQ
jgi:hypothetical protein